MSMPPPNDELTVTFPARLWAPIDATIDNSVSMAHVDGEAEVYEPGHRVREAGWVAMRPAPEHDDIGWPPADYQLAIAATRADWTFVLAQLDRWEPHDVEDDRWFYGPARQTIAQALGS